MIQFGNPCGYGPSKDELIWGTKVVKFGTNLAGQRGVKLSQRAPIFCCSTKVTGKGRGGRRPLASYAEPRSSVSIQAAVAGCLPQAPAVSGQPECDRDVGACYGVHIDPSRQCGQRFLNMSLCEPPHEASATRPSARLRRDNPVTIRQSGTAIRISCLVTPVTTFRRRWPFPGCRLHSASDGA